MKRDKMYLEIFLIALAIILLEVSYTRVFSFKLVYYFTYLIIGTALLGLGAGGVMVAMFERLRRASAPDVLVACSIAGGLSVAASYLLIANIEINTASIVGALGGGDGLDAVVQTGRLLVICIALFAPFLAGGLAIATIFTADPARINRLYFADLMGAGLGCAAAIPLMHLISPPGCVVLAGFFFVTAGLRHASRSPRTLIPSGVLAAVLLLGAIFPESLPDPVVDSVKTMGPEKRPKVVFSRWSPVFRVDVLEWLVDPKEYLVLAHDGMWGSMLPHFDGDAKALSRYDDDIRAYPFDILPPSPKVAIIGSAGGNEILASLHFDAAHVTGVELNPVTFSLLNDHFADYTGNVAKHEKVTLINGEGRAVLMGMEERFDLIWFVAPDSYAAMNAATAGAFVLSESYLYTSEMISESLRNLSDDGIICAQFGEIDYANKPNRTARYLTTARKAFREFGIEDFSRHVLLATAPGFVGKTSTILLKRSPFTKQEIRQFVATTARLDGGELVYRWPQRVGRDIISKVVLESPAGLERAFAQYPFDIRPVTDDMPFFWHFVSFRKALSPLDHLGVIGVEEGMGERLLMVLLVVAVVFAAVFLLAPLLAKRDAWRAIPYKTHAALYFSALGFGFMFIEVSLIQRLTLFLGYPTYSLTVTMFALLIFTGIGSLVSEKALDHRNRVLLILGIALAVLVVGSQLVLPALVSHFITSSMALRIALVVAVLAPFGLTLGVFMPIGLRTVAGLSPRGDEYVAWGWAVNGFCSVVSSVLSTVLAMTFGFDVVMLVALAFYAIGIGAMMRIPQVTAT